MDMRALLEKMYKFAGGLDQKTGPAGQLRGGKPMPKLGGKKHPAHHKLVGATEGQESILKELDPLREVQKIEAKLHELYHSFCEADLGTEPKRAQRLGARHSRGHEPMPRYKTVKEFATTGNVQNPGNTQPTTNGIAQTPDPNAAKKAMAAVNQIKSATGASAPAPQLAKALDAVSQGKNISSTDANAMRPVMDIISKTATDPALVQQFKNLALQAKKT